MSSISAIWLMCCWLPIPIWLALRNNARFKKNIVVGVTLPREAHDDEQITAILSGYRRQQHSLSSPWRAPPQGQSARSQDHSRSAGAFGSSSPASLQRSSSRVRTRGSSL